jgi:hypothetical protein
MTPEDLFVVDVSWSHLRRERQPLLAGLTQRFEALDPSPIPAAVRAVWLVDAVEELVVLLSTPSRLAAQARLLGETWPDPCSAPSFAVEGQAWMDAARECLATWTDSTDDAWRQAWLLLSDVLAVEALSPFGDAPADLARGSRPGGSPGEGALGTLLTNHTATRTKER